ncbi:MAG: hypothetical protein KKB51_17490 [Candidatus Riflebacteria bacterium]|nr:hypothetical protein [Candidatus Riflebacteria bacterium]
MKNKCVFLAIVIIVGLLTGCGSESKAPASTPAAAELKTNVEISADAKNEKLILGALWVLRERTPDFFKLVDENVKEIRQSTGNFTIGPIKTIEGTGRVEFKNFAGTYGEYNIADFLVHEGTHIVDQKRGLKLTRAAEIKAREAEIEFFRQLEKAENRSFETMIKFVQNEIVQIRAGKLYSDLD